MIHLVDYYTKEQSKVLKLQFILETVFIFLTYLM